jgi:hypothetical protein
MNTLLFSGKGEDRLSECSVARTLCQRPAAHQGGGDVFIAPRQSSSCRHD